MISLRCTNCKTLLEMDDAFAGGVCRCQHCGTIQTVPTHLKPSGGAEAAHAGAASQTGGAKTLYQHRGRSDAGSGTGLDDLAGAVVSSGLAGSGLAGSAARAQRKPPPQRAPAGATSVQTDQPAELGKKPMLPLLLIGGGVLAAGAIALILFFILHGHSTKAPTPTQTSEPEEVVGPSFAGVSLTAPSVVYVLDRGNATDPYFDALKAACYRSLELIGQDKKFAVILTNNGEADFAFPKDGMSAATTAQIDALRVVLQDVVATGNSHLRSALEQAIARKPASIVIATGKADLLDEDDAAALKEAAKHGIPIHTFSLGGASANAALQEAAAASGGQFKQLSDHELRKFSSP